MDQATRKQLGAFFTGDAVAGWMARWAVRSPAERVLEPSFGSGAFLDVLSGHPREHLCGVELDGELARPAAGRLGQLHVGDFLAWAPPLVDVVIGNPPYVRLRHLAPRARAVALRAARAALGEPMQTSGSTWMPFVLHAVGALRLGGRLALVLPYELTHVRYARPLWRFLGQQFGSLTVVRVQERLFPDLSQDVVLLLAEGKGGTCCEVLYQTFDGRNDLLGGTPRTSARLALADVLAGRRAFERALLPGSLRSLLAQLPVRPMGELCTFNIGYVSGHKGFFHPVAEAVPASHLRPALTSGKGARGLYTSTAAREQLYYPGELTEADRAYIARGEAAGVHAGYKTSRRSPWWRVPDVRVADLLLTVFADPPLMLSNDAGLVATNSLLVGFAKPGVRGHELLSGWYTSLSLLHVELDVHSLGGGVLVLVPREVARLGIVPSDGAHLSRVDALLRKGRAPDAFRAGDEAVLGRGLGLTPGDIELVREGAAALRTWRTPIALPR